MKIKLLICLIFIVLLCSNANAKDGYGNLDDVKYVKNYDGDTITFNISYLHPIIGESISVRVNGIDTPEIKGKCEKEKMDARIVKIFVSNELKNAKTINLVNINREKYFRILADVIYDGKNLKQELIKNGLAVEYNGGTKLKDWCE